MNSNYHSRIHAKKYGGVWMDYADIDAFIDSSKSTLGDVRHRALLHSTFGIFMVEKVFGRTITNADGKEVPVRLVAEDHIMQDLGFIPTVEHWLGEMPVRTWMSGTVKKTGEVPFPDAATRYRKGLKASTKAKSKGEK